MDEDVIDISDHDGIEEEEDDIHSLPKSTFQSQQLKYVNEEVLREAKYVITRGCLDALVDMIPARKCSKCGNTVEKTMRTIGCTVEYHWVI